MNETQRRAAEYRANGWAITACPMEPNEKTKQPERSKGPRAGDWGRKAAEGRYSIDEFAAPGCNIGALPGPASRQRVDVDLDSAEAIELADAFLPVTGLVHGRRSKPRSHRWYECEGAEMLVIHDPVHKKNKTIVELRVATEKNWNFHTILPGSVHPSGEPVEWESEGEPLAMEPALLRASVVELAIAAYFRSMWPAEEGNGRNELSQLLSGFLLKAFDGEPHRARRIFKIALEGKDDVQKRLRECFDRTERRIGGDEPKPTTGVPQFVEGFPHGKEIADWAFKLLGRRNAARPAGDDPAALRERVLDTNREFAVMTVGCKVAVAQFGQDGEIVEFWSPEEFAKYTRGVRKEKSVHVAGPIPTAYGSAWFGHPEGRAYERLVYAMPGSATACGPRDYNGWHGFTVEPRAGDWSRNRGHMLDVICAGSEAQFAWLLNWCAALVQKPGQHAWAAPVLRGGQGTGKGHFVVKMLGALFHRQQFVHLTSSSQLTENFNEHLSGKVLVFADESTWGGERREAGQLKGLITEPTVLIRRKYLKAVEEPSAMHFVIASNSDWPIPGDWDDRRFFVLDVSDARQQQDKAYFGPLIEELENGGRAAMLRDLLDHEVDESALRNPPTTKGKQDIKARSLDSHLRWLENFLMNDRGDFKRLAGRKTLWQAYASEIKTLDPKGRALTIEGLGRVFRSVFKRAAKKGLDGVEGYPLHGKTRGPGTRENAWLFPSLAAFREAFELATDTRPEWPEDNGQDGYDGYGPRIAEAELS